jgi:hypothetical protein
MLLVPLLQAVAAGHAAISAMCLQLTDWAARVGKPKRAERLLLPDGLNDIMTQLAAEQVETAYRLAHDNLPTLILTSHMSLKHTSCSVWVAEDAIIPWPTCCFELF